ncbi:hypothetical protein BDV96DRAFT_598395 [Lophiotrema nucula]|uniref:Beta/gamma crystallin 'Greek key' domain-containing protein n=1 Tax=Lophiotrema nucula TaxID=690887 RepID=A0A6A5ZAD9_9PLEO|nr:hypothetical protein BDV96DRAFT_598395 [Lophiotrema nucula]
MLGYILTASVLASLALAAPHPNSVVSTAVLPAPLAKRVNPTPGQLYSCVDSGFKGECKHHLHSKGFRYCGNFDPGAFGKISAVIPDPGADCWFFDKEDCYGNNIKLSYPGRNNLRQLRFDNGIKSWVCYPTNETPTQLNRKQGN